MAETERKGAGMLDLGMGVLAVIRRVGETLHGVSYWHPCKDHNVVEDFVAVKPEWGDGWTLVQEQPLTLEPSLLCRVCGHHGFIREGRWVPA